MDERKVMVADRMKALCSRREYCRSDIFRKACDALDGDSNLADQIVEELIREKYIDELRYSSAFARDKASLSGWGSVKIRLALSRKGISREVIDAAMNEIDFLKAHARLEKLMENKYRALQDDPQWKIKLLRFGLGRGYQYDEISDLVNTFKTRNW